MKLSERLVIEVFDTSDQSDAPQCEGRVVNKMFNHGARGQFFGRCSKILLFGALVAEVESFGAFTLFCAANEVRQYRARRALAAVLRE